MSLFLDEFALDELCLNEFDLDESDALDELVLDEFVPNQSTNILDSYVQGSLQKCLVCLASSDDE